MATSHNWEAGTLVIGQLSSKHNTPKIIYKVLHRTKFFVTLQKQDDMFCVKRKRPNFLITGKWGVYIDGMVFTELLVQM